MQLETFFIYYDDRSRAMLPECCHGIDNSNPGEHGWFEFLPILNTLESLEIKEDCFYGFFSPNFPLKTGLSIEATLEIVRQQGALHDVFIANYCWDQTAYFANIWEQGDFWHPGLLQWTQKFIDAAYPGIDVSRLVGHSYNTVASNYVIARGAFWKIWQSIARSFLLFLNSHEEGRKLRKRKTSYASDANQQLMVVFIQERFASLILCTQKFRTFIVDDGVEKVIFDKIFINDSHNKTLLQTCDLLKRAYSLTNDSSMLAGWKSLQSEIRLNVMRQA